MDITNQRYSMNTPLTTQQLTIIGWAMAISLPVIFGILSVAGIAVEIAGVIVLVLAGTDALAFHFLKKQGHKDDADPY